MNSKKEIEIKILNIDIKKIEDEFRELSVKKIIPRSLYREHYFALLHKNLPISSLRLRQEGPDSVVLALKEKRDLSDEYLIRQEYEVTVSDFLTMESILNKLDFSVFRKREKYRTTYKWNSVLIAIEEYPHIPTYIEIEAPSQKEIDEFLHAFSLSKHITTNKTASEIITEAGYDENNLIFK